MEFFKRVSAGVAGGAVFWFFDMQFLSLPPVYQYGGMIVVFVVCALAFWLIREKAGSGVRLITSTNFEKGLSASIDNTSVETKGPVDIVSGSKIRGPAKVDIKNTTIKN